MGQKSSAEKWGTVEKGAVISGLDGAGKSTLMFAAHSGEIQQTIPNVGFEELQLSLSRERTLNLWAVGAGSQGAGLFVNALDGNGKVCHAVAPMMHYSNSTTIMAQGASSCNTRFRSTTGVVFMGTL